ncbi:hypothetical protein GUITHDRAFT_90447 [Guillardia theta CCMP2712]|uniref:Uncharacterized protein n=2 Tax=Guillardia theta TaxID=55529 RepID=L1IEE5_GUITC|nr:hypothetical protein GUITHDRAFT_90447 [Guillardia theta CCMP2712]EKX34603.1 hypothetical protein GUITHDRAFT_90447 [Guillardia theta CCMP2712]|eukprot:XP_005821583.1 hypothetical protein GUITHDRAFT_90447 [Guillardia theta CCMP2712]
MVVLVSSVCPQSEAADCKTCTFRNSDGVLVREGICSGDCGIDVVWVYGRKSLRLNSLVPPLRYIANSSVFDGLYSLEDLLLQHNDLQSLPVGVFDGLSGLQNLYIGVNSLKSVPVGIFSQLSTLQQLSLAINKLPSLPDGLFDGLSSLQILNLRDNEISCISSQAFANLTSLSTLYLTGNNLTCYHTSWPKFAQLDANLEPCQNETHCDENGQISSLGINFEATTIPLAQQNWTVYPDYLTCQIQHGWQEIVDDEPALNNTIKTGGLGKQMVVGRFEVWVCSYQDHCARPGNAFCYVYDEHEETFVPWGLEDELMLS